jgi:hypothetical protein
VINRKINPDTTPLTQELDQDQEMDQNEHVDKDQHNHKVQEENNDQGGGEDNGEKDGSNSRPTPPYLRLRHTIQRDHLMNNILEDIKRG